VKDRRFLIKLFAIPAVILIAAFAYVILDIQSEEARQPEQYLGHSGDSHIKSARNTTSGIADESSSGAQFQREESLALEAKKEPQEVNDCEAPMGAADLPLRCTTLESDLALVMRKRQEEAAKKKAERLALERERKRQVETAAEKGAELQASEAEEKRQEDAEKLEAERLALEAEKKRKEEAAVKKEAELQASEAEKKRQEKVAKLEAERLALEAEKKQQEEANKEAERQALEANKKRQEEAAKLEVERLALEAEKKRLEEAAAKKGAERQALEAEQKRQEEAAKFEVERLALEAEKKRLEETAAKNEADRLALEAEKRRQEEAATKNEAERLALAVEKERQEEAARKDAERLALAADQKRQDELPASRPNAAGEAPATKKTNQQIVVPNNVGPASAPETTLETWVTGMLKPSDTAVQGATGPVSADLPAFSPSRVVLTYPRNDKAAAERATALRQVLTAANVAVVKVEAVEASRPTPGLGYYFRSDRDAAVDVSHRVQPLLGTVEPAQLEMRDKVPPPGTVEIAVPGRGAR
jgi:hypothetical protein